MINWREVVSDSTINKWNDRAFHLQFIGSILAALIMAGFAVQGGDKFLTNLMLTVSFTSLAFAAKNSQRGANHARKMLKHAESMVATANEAMEKFREFRDEGMKLRAEAQHISEQATIKLNTAEATLAEARRIREGR